MSLLKAARALLDAQQEYMKVRGGDNVPLKEEKGRAVGDAHLELKRIVEEMENDIESPKG